MFAACLKQMILFRNDVNSFPTILHRRDIKQLVFYHTSIYKNPNQRNHQTVLNTFKKPSHIITQTNQATISIRTSLHLGRSEFPRKHLYQFPKNTSPGGVAAGSSLDCRHRPAPPPRLGTGSPQSPGGPTSGERSERSRFPRFVSNRAIEFRQFFLLNDIEWFPEI